jgi:hypothetical protein
MHVHLTQNAQVVGTLFLDERGRVVDDGSTAARNAMDNTNHGFQREHGQAALDGIVAHFDRSTYVGAHHCREDHRQVRRESGSSDRGQD